jgi:hypothetical protein
MIWANTALSTLISPVRPVSVVNRPEKLVGEIPECRAVCGAACAQKRRIAQCTPSVQVRAWNAFRNGHCAKGYSRLLLVILMMQPHRSWWWWPAWLASVRCNNAQLMAENACGTAHPT